jgi:hypothetical protein
MPLPQVNDRLKEIPAQALRTVFATIGQLLLAADRLRARAAAQLPGSGEATATRPADQAPAPAPAPPPAAKPAKPARPARPAPQTSRWRSLDKTGNVRVIDEGDQDDEDVLSVTKAAPEPAPAPAPSVEYTPTEVVPAVSVPAEPAPAPAEPAPPATAVGEALPVPNFDELSVPSLRARLRVLDAGQVQTLLDYEKAHESRPDVITLFERRLTKLGEGN